MSQNDFSIANQGMSAARTDLNDALGALASHSSGSTAPSSPTTQQDWLDTSSTPWLLKLYDGADWLTYLSFNSTSNEVAHLAGSGSASAPAFSFSGDLNTGFYRIGADEVGLSLGGTLVYDFAASGLKITDADDTANIGPTLTLDRNSASPAASDVVGGISFTGRDSAGGTDTYSRIVTTIVGATSGSENATINFQTVQDGSLGNAFLIGKGLYTTGVTGGDKGLGTINIPNDIYKAGTAFTNPDYVFEREYTGKIEIFAANPGASDYRGRLSLADLEAFTRANLHLPGAHEKSGAFERADFLLEKLEEAYLHIFDLDRRLKALEAK